MTRRTVRMFGIGLCGLAIGLSTAGADCSGAEEATVVAVEEAAAQEAADSAAAIVVGIANAGFEESGEGDSPVGWIVPQGPTAAGYRVSVEAEGAFEGEHCALLDATAVEPNARAFGNMMQSLDATSLRGRRVRFRAAVRTDELSPDGQAQLWFRVDRPSPGGQTRTGAFDNMQDRPIREEEWRHYEIVGEVAADAVRLNVGMLVVGRGKAWLDDASLEIVSEETPATAADIATLAGGAADPPQPFFVPWLALAVVAIGLFGLSQLPPGPVQRLAFRFSFAYWLLYNLPTPFDMLPRVGPYISQAFSNGTDKVVRWTAAHVLGIERTLIPPNGSGDTTFSYVQLLVCFCLAAGIALVWSAVDRRKSDYRWLNDVLRSYLRYALAFIMLGYGLAKVSSLYNQFPAPEIDQLQKTYGDSSPMNLVWTFMGSSRAYTFISGAAEIAGALLLVWRRTTLLGALFTAGVTLNIVLLNFCYDVPVKQFSAHLLLMALYIALPDASRLASVLLWNRAAPPADLRPPYAGPKSIWVQRAVKAGLLVLGIGMPIGAGLQREMAAAAGPAEPPLFGVYEVESFVRGGQEVPPLLTDASRWRSVTLRRLPAFGGQPGRDMLLVRMMDESALAATVSASPDGGALTQGDTQALPSAMTLAPRDEGYVRLSGTVQGERIEVALRRLRREDFLLVRRGFRWINEYPFNR